MAISTRVNSAQMKYTTLAITTKIADTSTLTTIPATVLKGMKVTTVIRTISIPVTSV